MRKLGALALLSLALLSCARAPLRGPVNAFRKSSAPELSDDLPLPGLFSAVEQEIAFLDKIPNHSVFVFGERTIPKAEYLRALRHFLELGRKSPDPASFFKAVREEFYFYEVYGQKSWGRVFITSYYEPVIRGSLKRTPHFTQPLYKVPDDLVTLDLGTFDAKFASEKKFRGRVSGKGFVPYFSRQEIDEKSALRGKHLEICWVDPIDAFFLQVQGSGTVILPGRKKLRLNYGEKNGFPYENLSRFFKGVIPPDQMNMHTIEAYLRKLPRREIQRYLNMNPSYVFFRTTEESALTYLGVPATDGRTIATDPRYFPKGALAFLVFDKPRFGNPAVPVPTDTVKASRFVLDQDIGGAITGGGRVDLFWGRGDAAKLYAGAMKNWGQLYYLVPKGPN